MADNKPIAYVSIPDRRKRKHDRRVEFQGDPDIRLPPHSIEAEQCLIGALLLDNSAWPRIAGVATESDFYRDDHRRIFTHIRKLIEAGDVADVATVYASIESSNEVEQVQGLQYIGEIANNTPGSSAVLSYARIVKERALMRSLAECGERIVALATTAQGLTLAEQAKEAQKAWQEWKAEYVGYTSPTVKP